VSTVAYYFALSAWASGTKAHAVPASQITWSRLQSHRKQNARALCGIEVFASRDRKFIPTSPSACKRCAKKVSAP
jgi:hypothetical protein